MIRNNKWKLLISSLVILLPVLAGLLLWDVLPEQIPTHWGVNGQPDGWSSKAVAVFALPGFLLAMHWLCMIVTATDPKNKNQSPKAVRLTLWIVPALSLLLGTVVYITAMGGEIGVDTVVPAFVGLLLAVVGNYLPKCSQNHTIGIKISWTLYSEENWNATHRFAGKVWVIGGLVIAAGSFLPGSWTFGVLLAVAAAMVILPVVYSYRYYKKEQ